MSYKFVIVCLLLTFGDPSVFWAQNASAPPKKYRELVTFAERLIKDGNLSEAAAQLEAAYQLKPKTNVTAIGERDTSKSTWMHADAP